MVWTQHPPRTGSGQTRSDVQTEPLPRKTPPPVRHWFRGRMAQTVLVVPSRPMTVRQQAPVGSQETLVHGVPLPRKWPLRLAQSAAVVMKQKGWNCGGSTGVTASWTQQAPRGAQVLGVQSVLAPCQWPPPARHWLRGWTVQTSVVAPVLVTMGLQQAPRGSQEMFVQVVLTPSH